MYATRWKLKYINNVVKLRWLGKASKHYVVMTWMKGMLVWVSVSMMAEVESDNIEETIGVAMDQKWIKTWRTEIIICGICLDWSK